MTAMHPDSGVPWTDARNSLPADVEQSLANCQELWYSTTRCQPRFDPAAANAQLAELINLINAGGVAYDCSKLDNVQLAVRHIVQRGQPRYAMLTGGTQSYAMTLDPAPHALVDGMTITIIPNATNAGFSGVSTNGGPLVIILRNDGQNLKANDMIAGVPMQIVYYNGNWYVTGLVASQASFPLQARFETPGTFQWVVPPGVFSIIGDVYGGGGAGGTGMANFNGGAGGGGAGYTRKPILVTPGMILPVNVGAGGLAAGAGVVANGGSGFMSTFANTIMATGGGGGEAGSEAYPGTPASSVPGLGYYGLVNLQGAYGSSGASGTNTTGGYTGYGGLGGASPGPEGGRPGAMSTGASGPGIGFGAGGSGGGSGAGINSPGGNGHDGAVIINYIG